MLDQIEVFKPGRHVAIDGTPYDFSAADIAGMASAYDPALSRAPVVLGHPKTDDPAWGWAAGLTINDAGVLVAQTEKVDPAFAEGVEAGRYRYVSAKFYAPTDARNPKPGAWYLRHIGFLGAQPPAVKGLQPAFAEGEDEGELVAFAEQLDGHAVKSLFRGLRDWLIEDKGLELADRLLPAWFIDGLVREEGKPVLFAEPAESNPPVVDPSIVAAQAALQERETQIAAREVAFAEREREDARTADAAFLDGLVAEGRLPPVQRVRAAGLFGVLSGDEGATFSEPDAIPRTELRELLSGLGVTIQFRELAPTDPSFSEPRTGADYAEAIRAVQAEAEAQGRNLSAAEAAAIARNR